MSADGDDVCKPLPPHRCGTCAHWVLWRNGGGVLGQCLVRPGTMPTFSGPARACDVANGQAWVARGGV